MPGLSEPGGRRVFFGRLTLFQLEGQHFQNQLLGRFGSAVGKNKKTAKKTCAAMSFSFFSLNPLIEITGGDGINQFLLKIRVF